ncbi:hypothetical protein E4U42_001642 [Claviceps africana]|uniref:Uncharacterized protein n=1 Tax=Claviceps africana TaxID=83212 RepID=A0A8K0JDH8_9HYPO|nr:hypothetical protein E4U42_001642 [Claviceps africana]
MPVQLLPASAAAFAPRASSVNVVLGTKIEPWLTQTLKRVNRVKRPLNSVPQHERCLAEILSSTDAIWTLASLMLPKLPEADMPTEPLEELFSYRLLHIEAYIVHVDMILRDEVAFKLTSDTIDALVDHHDKIHCVDAKANTYDWSGKDQQCKKLHEDFVQAINKFVFRAHVSVLDGLEEEGTGELLSAKTEEVKNTLMGLMRPLLPPRPRTADVVRQPPLLPNSLVNNMWSQPTMHGSLASVDAWRVLPSSPSVPSTSAESVNASVWASLGMSQVQTSTPVLAHDASHIAAALYFSSPPIDTSMPPALPLPSMLASSQCGVSMGMERSGWHRYQDNPTIM